MQFIKNISAMGRVYKLGACLLVALALASGAVAGDVGRSYAVGVEDLQYYPLHTTTKANVFGGFAREVLDAFAKRQGYTFRYVPLPINRLYVAFLQEQSVDFKYPDNPKWKEALRRSLPIHYSASVITSEEGALVLPKNKGRSIKSLGTALGFTPWPYLAAIDSKAIVLTTSNGFDGLLRHALAEHIDAIYVNIDVANYLLAEELNAPGGLVFDPGLPHARSDFSLSTLRHPEVVAEFDAFLQREHGLLQKIREKYKLEERR
ncbi:polar amino acid transport system substrate-binding protein [Oxalobacteraceae bacterium GrIS 1.11]